MKFAVVSLCLGVALTCQAEDFFDRLDDALTVSVLNDNVRARLSGTLDLEAYHFEQPVPTLINSNADALFSPRLTLFLDAQAGSQIYFFAQARLDRGFDPGDRGAEARLDEYALRVAPWEDGRLTIQLGKFATVVGNFVPRHLSWENPFVTTPLVYDNVTALEDRTGRIAVPFEKALQLEKYELIPVIWGPNYTTGASVSGHIGEFDYAAEIKNRSLSSRPETWDVVEVGFENPTLSARLGFRPNQMWNFGLSVSDGAYLRPEAGRFLPPGRDLDDYREKLLGQDISFAWHHLQVWGEFYETRFEVPRVGDADIFAWYLEAKYKFTPQFFAALRWNQELFDTIDNTRPPSSLGSDLFRLDAAAAYRFTPHIQLKLQYSFQHETSGAGNDNHLFAAQFTVRF
jgi:hypothetical protein